MSVLVVASVGGFTMQTLSEIKQYLAEEGIRPKHRFGQNFLHDHNQIRKLSVAAGVEVGELVLEIGPGTGTLTGELLARGARVVACEIDAEMAAIVGSRVGARFAEGLLRVEVCDCLGSKRSLSPQLLAALSNDFKLVANLPYQITSPLLMTLLTQHWGNGTEDSACDCRGIFVMVQREAADRILAGPGGKAWGPLSILISLFGEAERIGVVPASCFWPVPKVQSALVAIRPREDLDDELAVIDRVAFAEFLGFGFGKRRKQLGGVFGRRDGEWPEGVEARMRAEDLSAGEWLKMWGCFGGGGEEC